MKEIQFLVYNLVILQFSNPSLGPYLIFSNLKSISLQFKPNKAFPRRFQLSNFFFFSLFISIKFFNKFLQLLGHGLYPHFLIYVALDICTNFPLSFQCLTIMHKYQQTLILRPSIIFPEPGNHP